MIFRPAKLGGRKVGLVVDVEGLLVDALSPRYEPAWGEASSIAIVLIDGFEVWGKSRNLEKRAFQKRALGRMTF